MTRYVIPIQITIRTPKQVAELNYKQYDRPAHPYDNDPRHKVIVCVLKECMNLQSLFQEPESLRYSHAMIHTKILVDSQGYLPVFPIEKVSDDFKYKKYIREQAHTTLGLKNADIRDIKLWSTVGLNHTYVLYCSQRWMPPSSVSQKFHWKTSSYFIQHILSRFLSASHVYHYIASATEHIVRTPVWEVDRLLPYTEGDIWKQLAIIYERSERTND